MDKSYIIRIYKQENDTVNGIVEDVAQQTREKFSNSDQLWSLIANNTKEQPAGNVIQATIFNTTRHKMSVSS